jgi:hypothetical protein
MRRTSGMVEITLNMMIDEVSREIQMRESVYGRQVSSGKLKKELADRRMATMQAVLDMLLKEKAARIRGSW